MSTKQLDSSIEPEKRELKDAVGSSNPEILGYGVMYTVGADWNCIVDHEWLKDKIQELGLPEYLTPRRPTPTSGYKRAIQLLRQNWLEDYEIMAPRLDTGEQEPHTVSVNLKEGDGQYIWHVRAEVFFTEEESKQEGGTWDQHDLGYFTFDPETESFYARQDENLDEEDHLYPVWADVSGAGRALFRRMQQTNNARDVRQMMRKIVTKYTSNVIKLRRSVYLFPAGLEDVVESMSQLYAAIDDEWKDSGEPIAIRTFEVLDTDEKREWVKHRVQQTLEDNIDKIVGSALEEFDEGEAAESVVREIQDNIAETEGTAEVYNGLLEAQISVEESLHEYKEDLADENKEDILERVLSQTSLDDV